MIQYVITGFTELGKLMWGKNTPLTFPFVIRSDVTANHLIFIGYSLYHINWFEHRKLYIETDSLKYFI